MSTSKRQLQQRECILSIRHPGLRLRKMMEFAGIQRCEMAARMHISEGELQRLILGDRPLTWHLSRRIASSLVRGYNRLEDWKALQIEVDGKRNAQ